MNNNGYEPLIIPADIDENISLNISAEASVMYLALKKALSVKDKSHPATDNNRIIIASDTIVLVGDDIIGKPKSKEAAFNILSRMRNKSHKVITGVCIIDEESGSKICFSDTTTVYFKNFSDEILNDYVSSDEPYDKAGGYAIQGSFGKYVDYIEGDYLNVVGFPWYRIKSFL